MPDVEVPPNGGFPLYFAAEGRELAERFCDRFRVCPGEPAPENPPEYALWAIDDHLELRRAGDRHGAWVCLSDLDRRAVGKTELARACGVVGRAQTSGRLRVLDAMAGWGLDGVLLARLGCSVVMVERHPLLHALLEDFVRRAGPVDAAVRLGDGYDWLDGSEHYAVVYLDPMFPQRRKRSLPGKRMQYLADLGVAVQRPLDQWLDAARAVATGRVVLKRRLHDPVIPSPDWQIRGRAIRYDVYRGRAQEAGAA